MSGTRNTEFDAMHKHDLRQIVDRLPAGDPETVAWCVAFFEQETRGVWHGRARALIARRLKHLTLTPDQRERLVDVILARLARGDFSEGFRDQLRLAIRLGRAITAEVAERCRSSATDHVRRYAVWTLARVGETAG